MINMELAASNLTASQLIIGSWRRASKNREILTAKFFYKEKKLVWEILDGELKRKIEIQWDDISAIIAHTLDNGYGLLEIQLNQPPSFFRETNHPQQKWHTIWEEAPDFTGCRICRKHTVYFPPGRLEKEYERLLECDVRLFELSNKPFPIHENLYFDQDPSRFSHLLLPNDITGYLPELPHSQHNYPVQDFPPPPILPPHNNNLTRKTGPPFNIMNPRYRAEGGRSYTYENQWGNNQGGNNHNQRLENFSKTHMLNYGEESARTNIERLNNLARAVIKYPQLDLQQEIANAIQDHPQPIHWRPLHQESSEGMIVNSSMNTSMYQYVPQPQISNVGTDVNSAINKPFDQYAPADQVSDRGMNGNSAMNSSIYQYAPPHDPVFTRAMNVNSATSTPLYHIAPTHPVSNYDTDVNSSMISSAFQWGNQGVNNGGSNYLYENIQWGNNGINNHNQGLDYIPIQGNNFQNYDLINYGDQESSGMNNPNNVPDACENHVQLDIHQEAEGNTLRWLPTQQVHNEGMNRSIIQYKPHHDQVSNTSKNVNSSVHTSTNPSTIEDFSAMAARQNTQN